MMNKNIVLTGACGSGKTYLACAIGHAACLRDYRVRYYWLSRLFLELTQSKADGTYSKLLKQLSRIDLLVLDDWDLGPLHASQRHDLMEILDGPSWFKLNGGTESITDRSVVRGYRGQHAC